MKYTLLIILLLFNCRSFAQKAIFAGGEITYEHLADSTYRFYANLYLDCAGGQEPPTIPACFKNPCNSSLSFTATLTKTNNRGNVAQMGCSQYPTNCSEPDAIRGYRIWRYAAIVTLPAQCNSWRITVAGDTMTKNQSLEPAKFFLETTFNNTGANRNNSSPFFADDAVAYCGEGIHFTFRSESIDPDGDLLVTEIDRPFTVDNLCSSTKPTPFKIGMPRYSIVTNPFPSDNTFRFDRLTGNISFYPSTAGTAIIALKIYEYRKGNLLGVTTRNQIIHIMPAPIGGVPLMGTDGFGNFYNCEFAGTHFRAHANYPFSFQFYNSTTAADGKLMMYDNSDSTLPGSSIIYDGQYTKKVIGTFSFNPTIKDTGMHYILLKTVDTTCRPPGFLYNSYGTISILIDPFPLNVPSITKGNFTLYPNPNKGQFNIVTEGLSINKTEVFNTLGQRIYSGNTSRVSMPEQTPAGIYYIHIYTNSGLDIISFTIN